MGDKEKAAKFFKSNGKVSQMETNNPVETSTTAQIFHF